MPLEGDWQRAGLARSVTLLAKDLSRNNFRFSKAAGGHRDARPAAHGDALLRVLREVILGRVLRWPNKNWRPNPRI